MGIQQCRDDSCVAERVWGQGLADWFHQGAGNQVVGSIWFALTQCYFSVRRRVCDQKDCAQLLSPAVLLIGFHCFLCDVATVFMSGIVVPWSKGVWRTAWGVQEPVLAMGRRSWDFAEMGHLEELFWCGLECSKEMSALEVWKCFSQRLWGMHFLEDGDDRWFCGYIISHRQGQDCSFEEFNASSSWTAELLALCTFVGLC